MPIPVATLVGEAARLFDVTPDDIIGPRRFVELFNPRMAVAYVANRVAGWGKCHIGRMIGGRDQKTIANAVKRAEWTLSRQGEFAGKVAILTLLARDYEQRYSHELIPRKVMDEIAGEEREKRRAAIARLTQEPEGVV